MVSAPTMVGLLLVGAIAGGTVVAIVSTARRGTVCHVLTMAALLVALAMVMGR